MRVALAARPRARTLHGARTCGRRRRRGLERRARRARDVEDAPSRREARPRRGQPADRVDERRAAELRGRAPRNERRALQRRARTHCARARERFDAEDAARRRARAACGGADARSPPSCSLRRRSHDARPRARRRGRPRATLFAEGATHGEHAARSASWRAGSRRSTPAPRAAMVSPRALTSRVLLADKLRPHDVRSQRPHVVAEQTPRASTRRSSRPRWIERDASAATPSRGRRRAVHRPMPTISDRAPRHDVVGSGVAAAAMRSRASLAVSSGACSRDLERVVSTSRGSARAATVMPGRRARARTAPPRQPRCRCQKHVARREDARASRRGELGLLGRRALARASGARRRRAWRAMSRRKSSGAAPTIVARAAAAVGRGPARAPSRAPRRGRRRSRAEPGGAAAERGAVDNIRSASVCARLGSTPTVLGSSRAPRPRERGARRDAPRLRERERARNAPGVARSSRARRRSSGRGRARARAPIDASATRARARWLRARRRCPGAARCAQSERVPRAAQPPALPPPRGVFRLARAASGARRAERRPPRRALRPPRREARGGVAGAPRPKIVRPRRARRVAPPPRAVAERSAASASGVVARARDRRLDVGAPRRRAPPPQKSSASAPAATACSRDATRLAQRDASNTDLHEPPENRDASVARRVAERRVRDRDVRGAPGAAGGARKWRAWPTRARARGRSPRARARAARRRLRRHPGGEAQRLAPPCLDRSPSYPGGRGRAEDDGAAAPCAASTEARAAPARAVSAKITETRASTLEQSRAAPRARAATTEPTVQHQ